MIGVMVVLVTSGLVLGGSGDKDSRQQRLLEEWNRYEDKVLEHSAGELSEPDRQMLRHLLTAANLVEELHMLQLNPENLKWRDQILASGSDVEKKTFFRYQAPWCGDDEDPQCCALESKPPREIGRYHWPSDLTEEEFAGIGSLPGGKALLSPFTVVRRDAEGKLIAIPYSRTELFGARMKALAGELEAAAEHASDPSLKRFLKTRAAALVSDDPYPYDDSDYDWIALEGDWEVTVGPYETYKNPYQVKALFEIYVGRENREISRELKRFKENLQAMENALGELVGGEIYQSRKLDPRIAIRAVDVWMAAGDGRRDRGATAAFHLPNRGRSVDEGLYKKVMMVNHSLAFEDVARGRAAQVLAPDQQGLFDPMADITNVTFHEFAHGFGAYHEMVVKTPGGERTTVKEALKEMDALLEELKADTFGLWLLSFQKKNGWVDEAAEKRRYTSGFMHTLGLLQYPLSGTYPRMVAIQLGWYLERGAVTWSEETGRFTLNFEKLPEAVESLAREVATIQLTGDYVRGKALVDRFIEKDGDDYRLAGRLNVIRDDMVKRFKDAGLRSPSLRYEVTGL